MKNKPPRIINVLRPKDKSLAAYKAWMKGIASQLAPEAEIQWTNYWQKQEKRSSESGPDNANAE